MSMDQPVAASPLIIVNRCETRFPSSCVYARAWPDPAKATPIGGLGERVDSIPIGDAWPEITGICQRRKPGCSPRTAFLLTLALAFSQPLSADALDNIRCQASVAEKQQTPAPVPEALPTEGAPNTAVIVLPEPGDILAGKGPMQRPHASPDLDLPVGRQPRWRRDPNPAAPRFRRREGEDRRGHDLGQSHSGLPAFPVAAPVIPGLEATQ